MFDFCCVYRKNMISMFNGKKGQSLNSFIFNVFGQLTKFKVIVYISPLLFISSDLARQSNTITGSASSTTMMFAQAQLNPARLGNKNRPRQIDPVSAPGGALSLHCSSESCETQSVYGWEEEGRVALKERISSRAERMCGSSQKQILLPQPQILIGIPSLLKTLPLIAIIRSRGSCPQKNGMRSFKFLERHCPLPLESTPRIYFYSIYSIFQPFDLIAALTHTDHPRSTDTA